MYRKIVFSAVILFLSIFSSNAQTAQIQEGSIINGPDGRPAGVVFHYDAQTGTGLMVSLVDIQLPWGTVGVNISRINDHLNGVVAARDSYGLVNTAAILTTLGTKTEYAARWCFELNAGGLTGWYLPSGGELSLLQSKRQIVNPALQSAGSTPINGLHWSSTQGNDNRAWCVNLGAGGDIHAADKNLARRVRAIRKF